MMQRIGLTDLPRYTGIFWREQVRSRVLCVYRLSPPSLRNQLSTRMEYLIQGLGFWNGASCHLIVKRLFANFT